MARPTPADTDSGFVDPSRFHPSCANALFIYGSVHFLRSITGEAGVNPDGSALYTPTTLIVPVSC